MGKHKQPESPFPEMNALIEGMQEMLTDEHGNPLTPDHPQYKKFLGLMQYMTETLENQNFQSSTGEPKGHT